MIGNDGILCCRQDKNQKKQFFKVQNTANGQKIYAKGLSNTKGTTGDGSLYVSGNFIEAFKELCEELKTFFPKVRTVGKNETNADECTKKVQKVLDGLTDTNLIASS